LDGARPDQPVYQFAHREPVTVPPEAKAHEAAARMMRQGVGSVVVADHEGVWGILTREDLAETVPELMRSIHCQSCGTRKHLRPGPGHTLLCPACATRETD
jgi:predicted transcriptional regulator